MNLTPLFQSNEISNSTLVYKVGKSFETLSLWQTKVFAIIMYNLQCLVQMKISGKNEIPDELPFDPEDATFILKIDLSKIVSKQNYKAAYEAIEKLQSGFKVILPSKMGKHREEISMIILSVDRPLLQNKYKDSTILIKVAKRAALAMADIKISNGRPVEFTKWYYEVAINATSKYTQKFYWLISAWKNENEFKISVDDLKNELGIEENELKNFSFFKREVLKRIEKDLKYGDCWIDLEKGTQYIKDKKSNKIIFLIFKIYRQEIEKIENNLYVWHIISTLRKEFDFKDQHVEELIPILSNNLTEKDCDNIIEKLAVINTMKQRGKLLIQSSYQGYIIKSIKNLFKQ